LDTQKTQQFLWVNPPENVAIKTRQKTHPKPNCTVLFVTSFTILKFKHPLIEHHSTFLDILKDWFPSENQKPASFISYICLSFSSDIHLQKPCKKPYKIHQAGLF